MDRDQPRLLIHEFFEKRRESVPHGTALHEGDRSITFGELDARANRVANGLRAQGTQSGSAIGLHLERSIDWVVGMLGILKANAAVVPLPPSNPIGWLSDILSFSSLDLVIDHAPTRLPPGLKTTALPLSGLESDGSDSESSESEGGASEVGDPGQAAFVLCSSGSTGQPKMIVRSHESFFHRLQWTWDEHPYGPDEIGCQKAHLTTTHSIYELFEPLLSGAPAVIIPDEDVRNLEVFWHTIRSRGITRLLIVPSALRASLDMPGFAPPPLKVLVLMGEYVHTSLARRTLEAFPAATKIYSIYGSTEASSTLVCDLREAFKPGEELSLGKPIAPTIEPLVLGPELEPTTVGSEGRLFMVGSALFTEYFRDPSRTASSFREGGRFSGPAFDTQDQVRLLPDGSLHYIGRADDTVKIRGFRVDLPEVERGILQHPDVSQATVLVSDRFGEGPALIAFYLPATVDRSTVYEGLRKRLPAYMVPSVLVGLDEFPLTSSGKVDRVRLLDELLDQEESQEDGHPLSETEKLVRDVWEETLGHSHFNVGDSFFEVGGDSLSVFSLAHKLWDATGLDAIQLSEQSIYVTPTLEGLAERIDGILAGDTTNQGESPPLLVRLRRGNTVDQPPFFFIASAGGTLGAYEKLARALTTTREIAGVRDPFNWGERDPTEGFQRWVGRYLEAIRERQPTGPYFLCAYSTSGAFGLEIARQLRASGQEVPLLALVDPLALDRRSKGSYGYWALRATYMRPALRSIVKIAGWARLPAVRLLGITQKRRAQNDRTFSADQVNEIADFANRSKRHLMALSALLELNTGRPFTLGESDFDGRSSDQYLGVLQSKVAELAPEVDPNTIGRITVQYELQVRTQHAYALGPYGGPVLLVEPDTPYVGLLQAQLRPHIRNLQTRVLPLGQRTRRIEEISTRFGNLEAHYRCMRDDRFVEGLAEVLDPLLD